jgi:methyltransferase (TIGR00027 family)
MENNQVSETSMSTAFCRAYHSKYDAPKIFDDALAPCFFTDEEFKARIQRILHGMNAFFPERAAAFPDQEAALKWFMQTVSSVSLTASRSRYAEDALDDAVRQGVRQYVILGAGMDTFAYRRTELVNRLQVFEADHPATQEYKRQRIAGLGWDNPPNLHYIPVDFNKDNLEAVLSRHTSYDPKVLTYFSWLGVVYYLPADAVFSTLRTITRIAPPGSSVVFDYFDTAARDSQAKIAQLGRQIGIQLGEQLQTYLDPDTLASEISALGLRLHENLSPSEIENRYFQGRQDGYHAMKNSHFAQAIVL